MAKALASASLTPSQLQMASTAFSAALKSLAADDRSFSYTVSYAGSLLPDVAALMAASKRQQVSTIALADALRGYLARQLGGKRCADTGGMTIAAGLGNAGAQPTPPDAATFFNTVILPDVYPSGETIASTPEPKWGRFTAVFGIRHYTTSGRCCPAVLW